MFAHIITLQNVFTVGCGSIPPARMTHGVRYSVPKLGRVSEDYPDLAQALARLDDLETRGLRVDRNVRPAGCFID